MFTTQATVDLSAVVDFDADGALQETADEAQRHSRRRFLRNAPASPWAAPPSRAACCPAARGGRDAEGRRRDPELRAHARVPGVGVLRVGARSTPG